LAFLRFFGGRNGPGDSANAGARKKWEDGQGKTHSAFDDFDQKLVPFAQKLVLIWGFLARCKNATYVFLR
jgi:hypothetical protein